MRSPLIERLILQFVLFGEVNPDRVYILGASHGGYGAFVIGPKIPDRFAAIHASASAPTDGETMGENLRNTTFTFMVGSNDTAYGRDWRCQKFAKEVEGWRAAHGGYPGAFEWKPGVGHSVPDRDKVGEMIKSGSEEPLAQRDRLGSVGRRPEAFLLARIGSTQRQGPHRGRRDGQHDQDQGRGAEETGAVARPGLLDWTNR